MKIYCTTRGFYIAPSDSFFFNNQVALTVIIMQILSFERINVRSIGFKFTNNPINYLSVLD